MGDNDEDGEGDWDDDCDGDCTGCDDCDDGGGWVDLGKVRFTSFAVRTALASSSLLSAWNP